MPGNFHIESRSKFHNLNPEMSNLSHTVNHLSFGENAVYLSILIFIFIFFLLILILILIFICICIFDFLLILILKLILVVVDIEVMNGLMYVRMYERCDKMAAQ